MRGFFADLIRRSACRVVEKGLMVAIDAELEQVASEQAAHEHATAEVE